MSTANSYVGDPVSFYDYRASHQLELKSYELGCSFYGLLMAAMRRADTDNTEKMKRAWPEVWAELEQRYHAPGGKLGLERAAGTEEFTGEGEGDSVAS